MMSKKPSRQPTAGSTTSSGTSNSITPFGIPASLTVEPLPRLIVFDLDYTLWPFWVDTHVYPPIRGNADHTAATDKVGEKYAFYRDVPHILHALPNAGLRLAIASRTEAPDLAREMLKLLYAAPPTADSMDLLDSSISFSPAAATTSSSNQSRRDKDRAARPRRSLDSFEPSLVEIYPASKLRHFTALSRKTGIPYSDMLFFDDESRNREVESLGVTFYLVRDGVSWDEVEKGVAEWRRRKGYVMVRPDDVDEPETAEWI